MRAILLLTVIGLMAPDLGAQSPMLKITTQYYRSRPFNTDFSFFLGHLMNDPTLTDKVIEKRTDTSLFFFQGTYSNHSPFFFKPARTKVMLTELAIETDSVKVDTIYNYQLLAFSDGTEAGAKDLRKEFDRIYRKYRSGFASSSRSENADTSRLRAITYNFFDANYIVAPFALTLGGPNEANEMWLVLTVRMSVVNNRARLPVSLYGF